MRADIARWLPFRLGGALRLHNNRDMGTKFFSNTYILLAVRAAVKRSVLSGMEKGPAVTPGLL